MIKRGVIIVHWWVWLIIFLCAPPILTILIKIVVRSTEVASENKKLRGIDIEAVKKTTEEIEESIQRKQKRQAEFQGAYEAYKHFEKDFQKKIEEADIETVAKMVKKLEKSKLQGAYKEYEKLENEISKLQKKLKPALEMLKPRESIINAHTMNPCF